METTFKSSCSIQASAVQLLFCKTILRFVKIFYIWTERATGNEAKVFSLCHNVPFKVVFDESIKSVQSFILYSMIN